MLSVFAKYNAKRQILTLSSGYAARFAEWHVKPKDIIKHARTLIVAKNPVILTQQKYLALKPHKTPFGKNDTLGVITPSFINDRFRQLAIEALFTKSPVVVRYKIKVDTHIHRVEQTWQESKCYLVLDANNELRGVKCAGGPPLKMPWEHITSIELAS